MTRKLTFWVSLAASAGLIAAFAYFFLPRDEIGTVLRSANFAYVAPSLVFYFVAVYARTRRWRFILSPLIGKPRRALFPVVVVGYMANNLLPVRLGEVVRSYYASIREPVKPAAAFGTIAIERAADVVALLFFIAAVWIALPASGILTRLGEDVPGGTPVLVGLSLAPFLIVAGILFLVSLASVERVMTVLERLAQPIPERIRHPGLGLAARLLEGLTVLRSPRALLAVFLLSLPIWVAEALMYALIGLGFNLPHELGSMSNFVAAVIVFTAVSNLAGVVPSVSGGIGPFEFFGAASLVAMGVPETDAGAYALTVHVALLVPVTILGGIMLLIDGVSFRSLLQRSKQVEPAMETETVTPPAPRPSPELSQ